MAVRPFPPRRAVALCAAAAGCVAGLLAGCSAPQPESVRAAVPVDQTHVLVHGQPAGAALWLHPADLARSVVVAAAGDTGLLRIAPDGAQQRFGAGAAEFVAIAHGFDAGAGALVVAHDRALAALRAYVVDPSTREPREVTRAPLLLAAEATGLCLYRSPMSGRHYAFVATDDGDLQQWELSAATGAVSGRVVRRVAVGKGVAACAVDDSTGQVYLADESVGIWRLAAEPESDTTRELLVLVAPRGPLGEEVKGLALHAAAGERHLLATDEEAGAVHVLSLPDGAHRGSFTLAGVEGAKFEAIAAVDTAAEPRQSGVLLLADEGGEQAAIHQVRWDAVVAALSLPAVAAVDPRVVSPPSARTVEPAVETEPVDDFGDAADDPAIWVHPSDPALSLIIGAQKKRGVEVYDLGGRRLQLLPDGRTNNVDVRQGVLLGGKRRDVVAGSNRESRTLALYEVDAATRLLRDAASAPVPAGLRDPYGLCMYHSAASGRLYVFMNNSDAGEFRQWEVVADGHKLTAVLVREFTVGTQSEGCVADDETGALYIAEEGAGLWRYGAEPGDGVTRRQIDSTGEGGHLTADVEGVAVLRTGPGTGWLVVSNQGADNYAVYRREGDNAFMGHFSIVANDELGIDGASETDGLDVTATALGPAFPHGLLVVQDGRNLSPAERQNYKLVPWERVAAALGLQ